MQRYGVRGALGLVHVDADGPATILDGGPGGIVELAATGQLRPGRPVFYAADLRPRELAKLVAGGARF